jgi:hypothetical protein
VIQAKRQRLALHLVHQICSAGFGLLWPLWRWHYWLGISSASERLAEAFDEKISKQYIVIDNVLKK